MNRLANDVGRFTHYANSSREETRVTTADWKRVWEIFRASSELPNHAREAVLQASGAPEDLLAEVRALLADAGDAGQNTPEPAAGAAPGHIGPYRLVRALGEGAMGTVYLAEQERPLRRQVAIKLVRPGLNSEEVLARFEIERRALALMEHPNIARVLDAGQTDDGRSYFAMEYVAGIPITTYCGQHGLGVRQRLELLVPVCHAIQHAHQKGIIHRDIKPRNVLVAEVDGQPLVKVIDFGVARAVEGTGGDSMATQFGSLVGTLAYMSPEQATLDATAVDTRSDIYSTGILAYELLTGTTPFSLGSDGSTPGLLAALEQVRTQEPEAPSRRLSSGTAASQLIPRLETELDWIVLKALEKEPARRYQTINSLARDVQRYLAGEPLEAARPSPAYRWRKRLRRHRWLILGAASFALVLVAATVISVGQAIRATEAEHAAIRARDEAVRAERASRSAEQAARLERNRAVLAEERTQREQVMVLAEKNRADREAAVSQAVSSFLQNDLLAQAGPEAQASGARTPSPDLRVREVLDRAAGKLERLAHQPLVRAAVEYTIGNAYLELGLWEPARSHSETAARLRRELLGPHHADTLAAQDRQASALQELARYGPAEAIWQETLAFQRKTLGEHHPDTLATFRRLGKLYHRQGNYRAAEEILARLLALRREYLGEKHPESVRAAGDLAFLYSQSGQNRMAEALQKPTYEARRQHLGAKHPDTLAALRSLAVAVHRQGRVAEAASLHRQAVAGLLEVMGPAHPQTRAAQSDLANSLMRLGKLEEALTLQLDLLQRERRLAGPQHPDTLKVMQNVANSYWSLGEWARSAELYQESLAGRQALQPEGPSTMITMTNLAGALRKTGDWQRAVAMLERVIEVRRRVSGDNHASVHTARTALALAYIDQGRFAEAAQLAGAALAFRRGHSGENFHTAAAATAYALALAGLGKHDAAVPLAQEALGIYQALDADHFDALETLDELGLLHLHAGDAAAAAQHLQRALAARHRRFGERHGLNDGTVLLLALARHRLGEHAEAERLLRSLSGKQPEWARSAGRALLGAVLQAQHKPGATRPLAGQDLQKIPALIRHCLAGTGQNGRLAE